MRTNVIFILDEPFPYASGGTRTWVYELSKKLVESYDVTIFSLRRWRGYNKVIHHVPKAIKIYSIPTLFNLPFGGRFNYTKHLFGGVFLFSLIVSLLVFLKFYFKTKKLVFISVNPGQTFIPSLFVRNRYAHRICAIKGPYVEDMTNLFPKFKFLFKFLQNISFKYSSLILLNGSDMNSYLLSENYLSSELSGKTKILPNGVDTRRFDCIFPKEKGIYKKIILLATLADNRGVPHLIRSIPIIKSKYKDPFKIIFVGKGETRKYELIAKELCSIDSVEFLGEKKNTHEILISADIAVALSNCCGISHSLLEEMASAKPIVAWNTETYNQVLKHEYSGLLVDPWNSNSLANALVLLLQNEQLAAKLAENAKKEAQKYDWNIISQKFEDCLEGLNNDKSKNYSSKPSYR